MARADVTVRGGGILGLACAWACAKSGAHVRVIESRHIGAGASGGVVGALAPHAPERWNRLKAFQLESLLLAEPWWAEVAHRGGTDPLYLRAGRLMPLADEAAVAQAHERSVAARDLWRGLAEWRVERVDGAAWGPLSPSGWVVRDTLAARIHPRAALSALAAALRESGASLIEGAGADDRMDSGAVIHATGPAGLDTLSRVLGRDMGGAVKGQAALLCLDRADAPQIGAPGLFVVPHGGGCVAVGSTSETTWESESPDALLEAVIARGRALVPALADAPVIERWAGLRPRASGGRPVCGPWPGRPGHFIANGGFRIGFALAPALAEGMAALVLGEGNPLPAEFAIPA